MKFVSSGVGFVIILVSFGNCSETARWSWSSTWMLEYVCADSVWSRHYFLIIEQRLEMTGWFPTGHMQSNPPYGILAGSTEIGRASCRKRVSRLV